MDDLWLRLRATGYVIAVLVGASVLPVSAASFPFPIQPHPKGQDVASAATAAQGASYVLGAPPRELGYTRNVQRSYDCSGLVWWAAATAIPDLQFPTRSQEQYTYGGYLKGSLWDGTPDFPVGSLLFLHDDNPVLGGGATHVSVYLGGGNAMDCYNEDFGCNIHNVRADNYYRDHWLAATYPWGDTPAGTLLGTGDNRPSAIGSGQIPALISQPGATYNEMASPVSGVGGVSQGPLSAAAAAAATNDPGDVVGSNLGGLSSAVGYVRSLDTLMPLRIHLALALVLVVLLVRAALSVVRYLIGLSPF